MRESVRVCISVDESVLRVYEAHREFEYFRSGVEKANAQTLHFFTQLNAEDTDAHTQTHTRTHTNTRTSKSRDDFQRRERESIPLR
jgi:hypothetical protein